MPFPEILCKFRKFSPEKKKKKKTKKNKKKTLSYIGKEEPNYHIQ